MAGVLLRFGAVVRCQSVVKEALSAVLPRWKTAEFASVMGPLDKRCCGLLQDRCALSWPAVVVGERSSAAWCIFKFDDSFGRFRSLFSLWRFLSDGVVSPPLSSARRLAPPCSAVVDAATFSSSSGGSSSASVRPFKLPFF